MAVNAAPSRPERYPLAGIERCISYVRSAGPGEVEAKIARVLAIVGLTP